MRTYIVGYVPERCTGVHTGVSKVGRSMYMTSQTCSDDRFVVCLHCVSHDFSEKHFACYPSDMLFLLWQQRSNGDVAKPIAP